MKLVKLVSLAVAGCLTLMALPYLTTRGSAACCTSEAGPATLIVSPGGPYTSIENALSEAHDGDRIEVRGGSYTGPLVIDKSVLLEGSGWPVIDGGGVGTVVTINAPDAALRGFQVQGSGIEPDRDHAGITITASDVVVEDNHLSDVLFGIFVAQADRAVVRGNKISSKQQYEIGRKGDAIRLWYSQDAIVEGNQVDQARDVVIWFSDNVLVRNNLIENGRYGIHLMYCDGARLEGNTLVSNSVGIYTMYSQGVTLLNNVIRRQRGPSGYALGFKDADGVLAQNNLLLDNNSGVFMDGTPFTPGSFTRFENNIIAFNDIGATLLTAVTGAEFSGNTFWENLEQVAIQGSGQSGQNLWQGNYWSDYAGFDADRDGFGELPYQADRYFESLTDREPLLRALVFSPAAQAIEFAATSFPVFKPQPKFTDETPSTAPAVVPPAATRERAERDPRSMAWIGAGMLALCGLLGAWIYFQEVYPWRGAFRPQQPHVGGLEQP